MSEILEDWDATRARGEATTLEDHEDVECLARLEQAIADCERRNLCVYCGGRMSYNPIVDRYRCYCRADW